MKVEIVIIDGIEFNKGDLCPRCGSPIGYHIFEIESGACLECVLDDYEDQNEMNEYFNYHGFDMP